MPFPYHIILGRETALPCPNYHNEETAMPFPYHIILGRETALPCPLS